MLINSSAQVIMNQIKADVVNFYHGKKQFLIGVINAWGFQAPGFIDWLPPSTL